MTKGDLLAEGRTSEVFAFGSGLVVKLLRPSVPDSWADVEASLTEAVQRRGFPAPRVDGVVTIEGRPGVVFERVDGPSMWQLMLDRPEDLSSLVRQFVDIQFEIQRGGLPTGLPDFVDRLCGKISKAGVLSEAERNEAADLARALPRGAALLHGDLHPGNILMGSEGPVVIDWFDASIGHPIADVVRSSILFRPHGSGQVPHLPGSTRSMLQRLHDDYRQAWGDVISSGADEIWQWEAVSAVGRLAERAQTNERALIELWRSARREHDPSPHLSLTNST